MRKVFLDDLPRWGKDGRGNQGTINWIECNGYKVRFIYEDIDDYIEILSCNKKNQRIYLELKYKDDIFNMYCGHFGNAHLGHILKIKELKHRYKIGEIIKTKSGDIEIIKQIRVQGGKKTKRGYIYKCLNDNNIDRISESQILNGIGCNVCVNQKILPGVNDLWSTHSYIADLLLNKKDGYTVSFGSGKIKEFLCPDCGYIKSTKVCDIYHQGFGCPRCGDGLSYPEKIMFNLLEQLNIKFIRQLNKKIHIWCNKYKYDFYIPSKNCIIETHGKQHYKESNRGSNYATTLLEQQEIDKIKKELALSNNIGKYIVIDCRTSDLEFIKNNILNSDISKIFNLSNIDWSKCHEYACNSLIKIASDYWNSGIKNTTKIANIMNFSRTTICEYLKKGRDIGICDYDKHISLSHRNRYTRKIICINTDEVFSSISDARSKYNISTGSITNCCKHNLKSAGKHPETGERLRWMYYDEYLQQQENLKEVS